jgi:hypothetical protein
MGGCQPSETYVDANPENPSQSIGPVDSKNSVEKGAILWQTEQRSTMINSANRLESNVAFLEKLNGQRVSTRVQMLL